MRTWLPGCGGAVSDGPIRQDSQIRVRFGSKVALLQVVDYAPPLRFGWTERSPRIGWRLWFRLSESTSGTSLTICEVWEPRSVAAWVRGRVLGRRRMSSHVDRVLHKLQTIIGA